VASCEGDEAQILRAVDTLRKVFDSLSKQSCYEREHKRESAEVLHSGQVVGV
jgi:hypothetical protein